MRFFLKALSFAARHLLASPLAAVIGCLLWTIMYLVLLLIAMIGGGGVGGPLAYPAGLFAILLTCLWIGWGIFAPACLVGVVSCSALNWPRLAAIPIVFLAGFALSYLHYAAYIEWVTTHSMPPVANVFKNYCLFISIPMGLYWWLTEGPGALIDVFRRWLKNRRSKKSPDESTLPCSVP
jgi:hypothetical protein